MKFDIKDLESKIDINVNDNFNLKEIKFENALVTKLKNLYLDINVHYEDNLRMVIISGSGTNGHIGFNEPYTDFESITSRNMGCPALRTIRRHQKEIKIIGE